MAELSVEIKGMDELKERLSDLEGTMARSILRASLRKAALILADVQEQMAPYESGKLADSVGVQIKGGQTDHPTALVGPDKEWNYIGRFHEFGTKYMGGDHWMQKAFDASANDALEVYVNDIKRRLDVREYNELKRLIQEGLSMGDDE